MPEVLELETRRKIFDCIEKNPGVNVTQISELLHVQTQLVDYHLIFLTRHELISVVKEQGYKRCYAKGKIGSDEKKILSLLRQEIPLKIVIYLLTHPYARHRDIGKELNISSTRISYHLKKLVKNGMVLPSTDGVKTGYIVLQQEKIINVLIQYQPTNLFKKADETWRDFKRW